MRSLRLSLSAKGTPGSGKSKALRMILEKLKDEFEVEISSSSTELDHKYPEDNAERLYLLLTEKTP